ncbi:MAG TPA: hypothetical protein DDY52_00025 [Candidatus Moranbacteria bacterium]|nr:MAG: hypothetical protein UR51_C0022G0021 [Candidatus Moranbacteria bacterium GW2011_GWF1_34_10]HBI16534.1 hypothetical protein [Candidatus Moranbacteria bacterium]
MLENTFPVSSFTDKEWLKVCAAMDEERKMAKLFGWEVSMFQDAYLFQGFFSSIQRFMGWEREDDRKSVINTVALVGNQNSSIKESILSSDIPSCKSPLQIGCISKIGIGNRRNGILAAVIQS